MSDGILLVDDDEDLRASVCDLVHLLTGKRCLAVASLAELVHHRDAALACGLAIVDVNLGAAQPSGIDVYEWLISEGFEGRAVFLTGHAPSHPEVARASRIGQSFVFAKPISVDTLQSLVEGSA